MHAAGSERYMNQWRDYKKPDPALDLLDADPEAERFQQQLSVDDWNAEILRKESGQQQIPLMNEAAPDSLAEQKKRALERIECVPGSTFECIANA